MSKAYRLEDDLLKKNRPKRGSKRYRRLEIALHAHQMSQYAAGKRLGFNRCERCGAFLINPQSILIHQGGFCQKRIANAPNVNLEDIGQIMHNLNLNR